jgi:hypothetical protein
VVDHIEPHKGDWNKFRLGAVQSLCRKCPASLKAFEPGYWVMAHCNGAKADIAQGPSRANSGREQMQQDAQQNCVYSTT